MPRQATILLLLLLSVPAYSLQIQQTRVTGVVKDSTGAAVVNAAVMLAGNNTGTYTGDDGSFLLTIKRESKPCRLVISAVGYKTTSIEIVPDKAEIRAEIIIKQETLNIGEISVNSGRRLQATMVRIPVKDFRHIPSASGNFESLIKTLPGVASNNELSSQYSVRGGSFDENLVYVNDIEIYRPFLIRSGQQEGLSFINPDLVSEVRFSAGGFDASFGDRLSSVLDIKYREPDRTGGAVSAGLLTSSVFLEGKSRDGRFNWLTGARYKSTRFMLKTLDSKGDYQPAFADLQSLLTYKTGRNSALSFLASYASNVYNFIPESRTSTFGTDATAYRLYVAMAGREKDKYRTWNAALGWQTTSMSNVTHKVLFTVFGTDETESFDIQGAYSLSSLDKLTGSENLTDTLMNIGIGGWLAHARNRLAATISSFGYSGNAKSGLTSFSWGAKFRNDSFHDRIKEWRMVDSAGYSVPFSPTGLKVSELVISTNDISNNTAEGYFKLSRVITLGTHSINLDAGIRGTWYSFSDEFMVSPRLSAKTRLGRASSIWIAGGVYFQPPFYREMRYPQGTLNNEVKSQRSAHVVAGYSFDFKSWDRPFRFTAEIFNKKLDRIIPYRLDNVRIIYSGRNIAQGYSRGIDMRLNGEFVPGAESWFSVSIMDSKLCIPGESEDKFPAPSDQTVRVSIFFQDYLPRNPTWRAHINISYATGIPVTSPFNDNYGQYFRMPAYRRVDLGMTKVIKGLGTMENKPGKQSIFREVVAGFEVFNLLDINNTVSYLWVRTVNNLSGATRIFAVPNYLTGRSLNFKLTASF
ncbi:MAG: TonB-dependent receptor [Bacteroidales bacterium]